MGKARRRPAGPICEISIAAPDLVRNFDDHAQLGPLLILGQHVAFFGRGEAALRRQAQLLKRYKFSGFIDAAFDVVLRLQPPAFLRYEAKHDLLVALEMTQRLEAASAVSIELQEITVDIDLAEQLRGHELVAA